MKKLFIAFLAVVIAIAISACNNNETANKPTTDTAANKPLLTTPPDSLPSVGDTLNK